MVHVVINSLHINLYSNKSHLIDVDPSPVSRLDTPEIQNSGKYTLPITSPTP